MRIQYSSFLFLSVFITMNACQGGVHRMYMESNESQTTGTGHTKEESHVALVSSAGLVSGHPDANTQNGHVLPTPSSHGVLVLPEQSVHTLQPPSAASVAKPNEAIVPSQDEKKEEAWQASPDLTAWFQRFVDAVDHAKEWDEVAGVLAEGRRHGYLDKSVAWDDDQYTPLHYAAAEGKLKIVKALVDQKVSVNITKNNCQRTPLHLAAQEGHLGVVRFLIEQCNAKWNQEDKDGSNVLHYAASGTEGDANVEVVKYLLEVKHANPSAEVAGFNVLYLAIKVNNPELVRYLVTEYPVLTTSKDERNVSPLAFAKATGRLTIVGIIEKAVTNISCF